MFWLKNNLSTKYFTVKNSDFHKKKPVVCIVIIHILLNWLKKSQKYENKLCTYIKNSENQNLKKFIEKWKWLMIILGK